MSNQKPTAEMILAYAADELDAEQRTQVEAYLAESPEAARMVARYRVVTERFRSDDSVMPPQHVLEQAKAVFRPQPPEAAPKWLERLDAFIARLIFDSRVQTAGVRYASSPLRVQLSYEHESASVDIQAERQRDAEEDEGPDEHEHRGPRWRVMGQLAGETSAAGVPIRLVDSASGRTVAETSADGHEMFEFEVLPGRYDLCAELPGGLLVMPGVELE